MSRAALIFRVALLVMLGAMTATAQTDATGENVAFAKFSPLPVFTSADLTEPSPPSAPSDPTDPSVRDIGFGVPLRLLEQTPTAAHVGVGGQSFWVHRADVMIPVKERYLAAGPGFSADRRPNLRFWRSLGMATEFLAANDVRKALPDLEEIRTGQRLRRLRLPVLARDVVDVMGRRPVGMVAVLLPISGAVAARFDRVRGAQQRFYDIELVVDASPDALSFSAATADLLYRRLIRYLRQSGDRVEISLTLFGANFWAGSKSVGRVDAPRILDLVTGPPGPIADQDEPLLSTLQSVAATLTDSADKRLIIALSGADIVDGAYSAALKRKNTLAAPDLSFPEQSALILAQVTPEPGSGLQKLSRAPIRAGQVVHIGFSNALANQVMRSVRDLLGAGGERPLTGDDLTAVCAAGSDSGFPCVLPHAPTTATALPRPPRRARQGGWYSTIVWVVEDGLILKSAQADP